jgi:hypothetical protein
MANQTPDRPSQLPVGVVPAPVRASAHSEPFSRERLGDVVPGRVESLIFAARPGSAGAQRGAPVGTTYRARSRADRRRHRAARPASRETARKIRRARAQARRRLLGPASLSNVPSRLPPSSVCWRSPPRRRAAAPTRYARHLGNGGRPTALSSIPHTGIPRRPRLRTIPKPW